MYKKAFWKTVLEIIHAIPIPPSCNCSSADRARRDARTVRICPRVGKSARRSAREPWPICRDASSPLGKFPIIGHSSLRTCLFSVHQLTSAQRMRTPDDIMVPTRPMSETRARPGHETTCRHRERAVPVQSILVQSQLPCMQHVRESESRVRASEISPVVCSTSSEIHPNQLEIHPNGRCWQLSFGRFSRCLCFSPCLC